MEETNLFSETQKFKQWWIWLILIGINGLFLYSIYQQVICGKPFGTNPASNAGLFLSLGVSLTFSILFSFIQLETRIKNDGIYVKFFPFQVSYKRYTWDQLTKCYIRQYNPIGEYGGWGFRMGLFGKGRAFNVSGDMGLQLEFTNNRKLLIGTAKPAELLDVLTRMGKVKK